MGIATGTVIQDKVLLDGVTLPEGAVVTVLTQEAGGGVLLSDDVEAALLEAVALADRGETISPEELFERLDRAARH